MLVYDVKQDREIEVEKIVKTDDEWQHILTEDEYRITTQKGTETPGTCLFEETHGEGIFRCVRCGTDLFRSTTKYDSGTGWQTATIVEDCESGMIGGPKVAVNDWGDAIAVWERTDGDRIVVKSSRYDVETGWELIASFEICDILDVGVPQVGIDDSGNAIVVWWQYDGTVHDIWSNRYVKPDTSTSSPFTSVNAIIAVMVIVTSMAMVSVFWLRKRKEDRSGKSIEEKPPPSS